MPNGKYVHTGHKRNHKPSPTWISFYNANQRCTNPKHRSYQYYGARGVKVLFTGFAHFLKVMGVRPKGTTLDRYPDPTGNYEPGNCRWATVSQQNANRAPGSRIAAGKKAWETRKRRLAEATTH